MRKFLCFLDKILLVKHVVIIFFTSTDKLEVLLPTYIDYAISHFGYTFHRYEYRWADGVTIKKPIEVSAPKYVEYLMDWIEAQLDDESIFPQKIGE